MGMGMGMGIDFENPTVMSIDMGMTFENGYGCRYNSTCLVPASDPSLGYLCWRIHPQDEWDVEPRIFHENDLELQRERWLSEKERLLAEETEEAKWLQLSASIYFIYCFF